LIFRFVRGHFQDGNTNTREESESPQTQSFNSLQIS
jgi:hypothetical protein